MRPRRLLLLTTDLEIGGTPTVVRDLAVRLNEPPTVEVEVACLGGWGPVAAQLGLARIPVTAFEASSPLDLAVLARLTRLLRGRRFDTCLSFLVHANACAAIASLLCPGTRFLQSIQTTQPYPRWHWMVQTLAQLRAERVVVPSPSAARAAVRWARVAPGKCAVIPNAVDASAFLHPRPTFASPRLKLGFLGRLDPVKRVDDLLDALALLGRDVELHIFGDGEQREHLHTRTHELSLSDRVVFHGSVARPQQALDQIDLLVLPSLAEGFGLVLIEAMAAGVPVIATNVSGIRDVVEHERTGLLVPVRSPRAIADAVVRLRDDAALRERLIEQGMTEVRDRYSFDAVMPLYRALLRLPSR
jgi:glycosyltransferase involved in cell wall biosynthesis